MENNTPAPTVTVVSTPNVYIDVVIGNEKQVYPVEIARALHAQLGESLAALDAQINLDKPAATD